MNKSIKEIAQGLNRSPQELLSTIRGAGIEKSGVDDVLTPAEKSKLSRALAPERRGVSNKWSGEQPSSSRASGGVPVSSRGAAHTIPVKVRKRSARLTQKNQTTNTRSARSSSGATDARKPVENKSTGPASPVRKRTYSAETKKIIKDDTEKSAKKIAAAPAPTNNNDALSAPLDASPAIQAPAPEATGKKIAGKDKATTSAKSSISSKQPGSESSKKTTPAVDKDLLMEELSTKKSAKGEGSAGKRASAKRERDDIIEIDADYVDPATVAAAASVVDAIAPPPDETGAGSYAPANYLHIKKSFRKRRKVKTQTSVKRENLHAFQTPTNQVSLRIELPQTIAINDLAKALQIKRVELLAHIKANNIEAVDDSLDQVSAQLVVENLGHKVALLESENPMVRAKSKLKYSGEERAVPPVVTIMGHVDHGKTTLIDRLRQSHLVSGEYGTITQHIGAYCVPVKDGDFITFLDTPGHAAFANMREHGARVTDVVVIVVAADDGVKPQTIESIEYAKRYQIPIVVAINKVDKENANSELIRTAMSEHEIVPEDWGGDNQFVEISALKNKGIDKLLEAIHLQAEMIDKKVPVQGDGFGYVIESGQRKGLGITATVLLKKGQMKKGQIASAGRSWGRIRFLLDEDNKRIDQLTPGLPATLLGLSEVVESGSEILITTEGLAREIQSYARQQYLNGPETEPMELDTDALFADLEKKASMKTVNLYIKTDVQGSTDAIRRVLEGLEHPEFQINIVACRQGGVYESDVQTAASTESIIIGFNVSADNPARKLAEKTGAQIHLFRSVYEIFEFVDGLIQKNVKPVLEYTKVGEAQVREVFRSSAFGSVAGCMIVDGAVHKNDVIRVVRDSKQIFEGRLDSLRRFKDDAQVVNMGSECGIAVKKFNDLREQDLIQAFNTKEIQPSTQSERESSSS